MSMPLYASPEQLMRERSELARKGIARGKSVVALKYRGGVLFVAENPSTTLHKVSEIYNRIGFAAAGRYSEYESLRRGGIRHVDLQGYAYDPRDVSARQLANVFAQTLGGIFTEQVKPFEVEICVAEVGTSTEDDWLYRLTYDGSIVDEPRFVAMGGQSENVSAQLKETFEEDMELGAALGKAVDALQAPQAASGSSTSGSGTSKSGNGNDTLDSGKLEVAVLDRDRPGRTFRRISGAALDALLPASGRSEEQESGAAETSGGEQNTAE